MGEFASSRKNRPHEHRLRIGQRALQRLQFREQSGKSIPTLISLISEYTSSITTRQTIRESQSRAPKILAAVCTACMRVRRC